MLTLDGLLNLPGAPSSIALSAGPGAPVSAREAHQGFRRPHTKRSGGRCGDIR